MGIIKWLNSHAIPATIFYFALMGGIAWGVNQSIADRTALEAMPADGDLIAIYDLDATAGKSIAVSTFRGDNLNAIVNAATGVTDPAITMYDSSSAAGTADIYGTSTGSYDVVMSLGVEDSGSATGTDYIQLNGTTETVSILKPLSFGTPLSETTSSPVTIDSCRLDYYQASSGNIIYNLPQYSQCNSTESSKIICFKVRNTGDMIITPYSGDRIEDSNGTLLDADATLQNTGTIGDFACFHGRDVSNVDTWMLFERHGVWDPDGVIDE